MRVRDICEKLRSGEMTLDYAGHIISIDLDTMIEMYDNDVEVSNGSMDNKWNSLKDEDVTPEKIAETNQRMRDFYKKNLDFEIEQDGSFHWGRIHDHQVCHNCGEHLNWTLTGDKLQLRNRWGEYNFENHPVDYICPLSDLKPFVSEIKIESDLVVANYFEFIPDIFTDREYSHEYSLNHLAGRIRRAEYKATKNVAYGQMGNMSIGVYLNEAKDSVIIGNWDDKKYEDDEEGVDRYPGYKMVGEISLGVWRWEATDLNTILSHGKTLEDVKKDFPRDNVIVCDVVHGTWTFQHNYDVMRHRDYDEDNDPQFGGIYARLDLKK